MQNCTKGQNSTREWGANEPPAILCIIRIGMIRSIQRHRLYSDRVIFRSTLNTTQEALHNQLFIRRI